MAFRIFSGGMQDLAPFEGIEPRAPARQRGVLATGPSGLGPPPKTSSIMLPSVLFALRAPLPLGPYMRWVFPLPLSLYPRAWSWGTCSPCRQAQAFSVCAPRLSATAAGGNDTHGCSTTGPRAYLRCWKCSFCAPAPH